MTFTYLLYILGGIVALYLVISILVGIWKGWGAVKSIWTWTKKLGWVALIIIGILITAFAGGRKNKQVQEIDQKLKEAKAKEDKTQEDLQEIKKLEEEKKKAEDEIVSITEKYKKKLEELKQKEKEPEKPGDAGRSKDDLDKIW